MAYTKEETKKIKETTKVIVKDLRTLWKLYPYDKVTILLPFTISGYDGFWKLVMDKKNIKLINEYANAYTNLEKEKLTAYDDIEALDIRLRLIEIYEKVRVEVEEIQQFRAKRHQQSLSRMDGIKNKYSEKAKRLAASVQIDFNSQNAHEIEIKEENGNKIGIINFGGQTIKLITEGDIIVIDKTKHSSKTKQK